MLSNVCADSCLFLASGSGPVVELGFISSLGKFSSLSVSSVLIGLGKEEFAG
jgi:hypothetical protein